MKLIRFGEPGKERPGLLLNDGTFIDTSGFRPTGVFDYDEEFFAGDGLAQLREWTHHRRHTAARVSPSVRLGPPIDRPSKIVCIGLNSGITQPRARWDFRRSQSSSSNQQHLWWARMILW
jgi:2,4-diketo-3-deoxy-L-fuconate hydrolase